MRRILSFAALGALALLVLSGVPFPYAAQAQSSPSVALSLSSTSVEPGTEITVTMSFRGLEQDSDRGDIDYIFRADVVDADGCEDREGGYGLGVDRYMRQVDEDPEVRTGTIAAGCPAGAYTLRASVSSANNVELASASAEFSVTEPEEEAEKDDPSRSAKQTATPQGFSLHSDNGAPEGIWSDGATIWVADSSDDKLYAYALYGGTRQDGTGDTTNREFALHSENSDPWGIWSDGTTIWVADRTDDKLYACALDGGRRQDGAGDTTSREFALHSDNGASRGIWSDGATIWVADSGDDKLYAYDLDAGRRQDGTGRTINREFALHSKNDIPSGIWSNGSTIWVADPFTDRLYVYALPRPSALSWLSVSAGTLTPAFNSDTLEYAVPDVPYASSRITVTATSEDGIRVGEVALDSSLTTNSLIPGTYYGPGIALTALSVSPGTLRPAFDSGALEYAVPDVPYASNRITVTASSDATVSYEDGEGAALTDADADTAGDQFDLAVGENTIKVKVTRGGLSRTYTLTVTRAKPTITVSAAAATAGEGALLTFTVARSSAAGDALTLTVNVSESGSLLDASEEGERTVTIAAGETEATLKVATDEDTDWEEHSTVSVTVLPSEGYTLGADSASTLVEDDDFPTAEAVLAVSPTVVGEPGTVAVTVTVTTARDEMPHGPGGTLTVTASDVTATSGATTKPSTSPTPWTPPGSPALLS